MALTQYRSRSTTVAKVHDSASLKQILDESLLEAETIIVKPNWVDTEPGGYTDTRSLRVLFEALDTKIIVTESLHFARVKNLPELSIRLPGEDRYVDWHWFLKGEGWRWLIDNPDWSWFKDDGWWDQLHIADKEFLDEYGYTDLFQEFDVTYINTTNEVWGGGYADPMKVKEVVEQRFPPVMVQSLYGMVPEKLYMLRGSPMISFARLKQYATFTLKNMFGLIIHPMRTWWHDINNVKIASSIVDINKVYHSLFNMYGICESLYQTAVPHPEGEYDALYMGRYDLIDGFGVVATGKDLVALDSLMLRLNKKWINISEKVNVKPIQYAEEQGLGHADKEAINKAEEEIGNWYTFS